MLIDFAYFAEIVAAIGVILSLIYVGKQLKQTNTIARSAFRQTLGVAKNDFAMSVATSSSLAEVVSKVHEGQGLNDTSPRETIQVGYAYWALIGHVHLAFEHWKDGILTEDPRRPPKFPQLWPPENPPLT